MMEMHSILMLVSILSIIFFLIYMINTKQKKMRRKISEKQEPRFGIIENRPNFDNSMQEEDDQLNETSDGSVNLLLDDPLLAPKKSLPPKIESEIPKKSKAPAEEIIYLILAAKPNKPYVGYELLQALLSSGLRFGVMNIFHRYEDLHGKGKILYSLASASEQGTFEINKIGAFSGKGLIMFLKLSSNKDLIATFDQMLETAKQLIEDLDGDLLDEERKILTHDKIEIIKKKITEYEQKQLIGDLFDS